MAEHPLAHHFAEVLSQVKADPACRECKGKGPRLGFITHPDGKIQLSLCCGSIGETEYTRLTKRIDAHFPALSNRIDEHFAKLHDELNARTVREEQRFNDLLEAVREQSWFYRVRKWWRNRGTKWPTGVTSDGRIQFETHIKGSDLIGVVDRFKQRMDRGGYQPKHDDLSTPPQGGSGVPQKPPEPPDRHFRESDPTGGRGRL